jgi:hypothetical protein
MSRLNDSFGEDWAKDKLEQTKKVKTIATIRTKQVWIFLCSIIKLNKPSI